MAWIQRIAVLLGSCPQTDAQGCNLDHQGVCRIAYTLARFEVAIRDCLTLNLSFTLVARGRLKHPKTDHGRTRAWLRMAVNEQSLESYATVLLQDKALLVDFYEPFAFIMDEELGNMFAGLLAGISNILFELSVPPPV